MKSSLLLELSNLKQASSVDPTLAARMFGRSALEGSLGGAAGMVLGGAGGILTGIPAAGLVGKLLGGLTGSVAGSAHGAYAAAKNHGKPKKKPSKKKEEPKEKSAAAVFNKYKDQSVGPRDLAIGGGLGAVGGHIIGQRRLAEMLAGVEEAKGMAAAMPSEENVAVSKIMRNKFLLSMLKHIGLGAGIGAAGVYGYNRLKAQ